MSARKSRRPRSVPAAAPPSARPPWLLFALLLAVTLVAYAPAWHGGMIWDDDAHITRLDLRSVQGLWRIWFEVGATQQYYPVAHSAFWVFHRLWGDDPLGYHLVNIALHACSAGLVLVILRRLAVPGAWLAAVVFALHPVQVESVAWMTELKNTLSGALYLGACLAYLRFDAVRSRRAYALAAVLFVLALLSKTVTATLPAALLVVFWWRRGTLRWREDVWPLVPFFAIGLASGLLTAWVERTQIGAVGAAFQLTLVDRCLIAGRAFWFYLAKLAWPADLIFIYPRWHVSAAVWWQFLYPAAALALLAALWWYRTRSRAPLAAMLFFGGTLFPALGFVNVYPFVYSFVADHFQYLACLGPIALAAGGVATLAGRWRPALAAASPPPAALAGALALALPLGVLTWNQCRQYADAETLYRTTLARNPECWMAHVNLGKVLQERARATPGRPELFEPALAEFRAAIALAPEVPQAHNNLGTALLDLGRFDEAKAEYREALRLRPGDREVTFNLSRAFLGQADALTSAGQFVEAIAEYAAGVQLAPEDAEARNNFGSALAKVGRLDEAVTQFREALRLNPGSARAAGNLGFALLKLGRTDEALSQLRSAVAMQPDFALAHYNLANALEQLGRHEDAAAEFAATVKYQPDFADAHNDLGIVLAELGRYRDAVVEFREALRLRPDFDDARANLARALAMIK